MDDQSGHILSGSMMPKKSSYTGEMKRVVEETVPPVTINAEVLVQSLIEAHLTYTGRVSGKQYEWLKAGNTVLVLEEDVPELISKRLGGNPCCGNPVGNKIFEVYHE